MSYFGVYIPGTTPPSKEDGSGDLANNGPLIFEDLVNVLETIKLHKEKNPRFKHFSSFDDARKFAIYGSDILIVSADIDYLAGGDQRPPTPRPPPKPAVSLTEEIPRPFPAPTRPELTDFKKAIESKNIIKVGQLIDSNPRYLINCNGDTPTILQEGFRYNALHVAARTGNLEIAKSILEHFKEDSCNYIRRLYPDDKEYETTSNRRRLLLDFYLNTPDKGFNETPLHFAVKNGFVDLVKYLCSFQECQRDLVNKNGQTPKDLALESDRISTKFRNEIFRFLEHGVPNFYIPLYRATDNVYNPILRQPISGFPESKLKLDVDKDQEMIDYRLAAYIGPIDDENAASKLYSQWISTEINTLTSKGGKTSKSGKKKTTKSESKITSSSVISVKRSDLHKGMEQIGRRIASNGNYPWSEYWAFLRAFVDLRTEDGLNLLEQYFRQKALKEEQTFEKVLETKIGQLGDKLTSNGDCKRKLDFQDLNDSDESSRDSSDLFFDADETSDDSIGISNSRNNSHLSNNIEKESESQDGYFTPPQELTGNVILGKEPTKLDRDVYAALEDISVDDDRSPYTVAWMKMIRQFSEEERRKWVPFDSPRSISAMREKFLRLRASD